jgi:Holliday junction resolvasome RuvABC endonuclease subunit
VVKKFATGKGNADKQKIQDYFIAETSFNIKQVLSMTEKQWNPSSDLIDAFYICKFGVTNGNLAIPG